METCPICSGIRRWKEILLWKQLNPMGVWKCSLLQHNLVYFNQSTICGAQSAFVDAPPKHLIIILLECLNQMTIKYNRSSIWDHTGISHQNLHTIFTESYFSSAHSGLCVFFFLHILRGGRKLAPSAQSFIFRSLSHRRSLASATVGADNKYGEAIYNHNSSMRPFQASWPSWGFANLSLSHYKHYLTGCEPVILALGMLRQKNLKFEEGLG